MVWCGVVWEWELECECECESYVVGEVKLR